MRLPFVPQKLVRGLRMRLDSHRQRTRQQSNRFSLVQPGMPEDIGSDAHRQRLEAYARARLNRPNVRLAFSAVCSACGHPEGDGSHCSLCPCQEYKPGGASFTDMAGSITVQSNLPPDGSASEKELCIRGLLRHEICHEARTDPSVHRAFSEEMKKMINNKQEITAMQLQRIWNTLEDGMIEERERDEEPSSYAYISALNRLYPRVGRDTVVEEEMRMTAPDGYIPEDIQGKKLKVKDGEVIIPPGTRIGTWGEKPLSKAMQMEAALLAESVPEFAPGKLHPDVKACLNECRPYIDAAIGGNTADCVANAYPIHSVMRRYGFLREDLSDQERKEIEELIEALGQLSPTAPDPHGEGGEQALNPIGEEEGQIPISDELREKLGKGDGQDSEQQRSEEGGRESGGGYDPQKPLPRSARDTAEREGRGRVDGNDLEKRKREAESAIKKDQSNQQLSNDLARRQGRFDAGTWNMPQGNRIYSQRELKRSSGEEPALADEIGQLSILGRKLAAILARLRSQTRAPQSHRRRGRLDSRRLAAAVSGNPRVFMRPGENLKLDLELDVIVDRSGSVTSSHQENNNQYRMAQMFASAARDTNIPTTIYGWDGSGWDAGETCHYAYKERHSTDLSSLDSFFRTGGGGTPTADGIEFARARLAQSSAAHRAIICITDGAANDIPSASEQCRLARAEGLVVIGIAFSCNQDQMNQQFGPGNWLSIEDYTQAPLMVGEMVERLARSRAQR